MASSVEIANRALSKLGEVRITSLLDDNKPARAMNARFALLRDAELAAGAWRFAVKRVELPALADAPTWGYAKAYQLPNDHLRPLMVGDLAVNNETLGVYYAVNQSYNPLAAPFEIIGDQIQTDQEAPLKFEYVRRIEDSGLLPVLFVEALAARLAMDASQELTQQHASKHEQIVRDYQMTLREARRTNALWRPPSPRTATPWMMSRF